MKTSKGFYCHKDIDCSKSVLLDWCKIMFEWTFFMEFFGFFYHEFCLYASLVCMMIVWLLIGCCLPQWWYSIFPFVYMKWHHCFWSVLQWCILSKEPSQYRTNYEYSLLFLILYPIDSIYISQFSNKWSWGNSW